MLTTYTIYFRFRSQDRKAYVHDFGDTQHVAMSDEDILQDFSGVLYFDKRKYKPGFLHKPATADLQDLINAIEKQLQKTNDTN